MNVRIRDVKYLVMNRLNNDKIAEDIFNQMIASMYAEGMISFSEMMDLVIKENDK